ncbi:MAG: GMC family oxidoreductase N-terminal domain-containing protein, partial [Deltaproteobacteria bacterium]|nr:GMC family oxidoreductase N-terminal domain-containing protein [Deltaproteobacteria bacterium]MBW2535197.1 GMC family oxidoreductase N-terminal domain-containing protein [Deltaproteobacteria bacterium]
MNVIDGAAARKRRDEEVDVVVVGSGPAGAAAALALARGGARVAVVEEGPWVRPEAFPPDGFSAMAELYRDMGASVMTGRPPMPVLQGRVVGGTSVVNGAISWRLPKDVYDEWTAADPALDEALRWTRIERALDEVESELHIAPTDPAVAGAHNALLAKGAAGLGLEHRPIARNVSRCRGLGRCLQGCPAKRKQSMDLSYLPEACALGAVIFSSTRVDSVRVERGRATAVVARTAAGAELRLRPRRAVVLAASAIQTPALLLRSGMGHGPVGQLLQCHPGVSVAGRFAEPVQLWTGATQGHEVIGLRGEGLKFEALGYDLPIA